ncbi:MAG TPA: DedA family protein [Actinomycetota bacterium]
MVALLEEIVEFIGPLFNGFTGYAIVTAAVLLERSILIGVVVPGEVTMAAGALFAARGQLSLTLIIVLGALAAVVGESIGFWLGRRYGRSLMRRLPLLNRFEHRIEDVEELFDRHGGKAVAVGRFAAGAGVFIPFVAGMGGMRYRRFLLFDVPSIVIWAVGVGFLGYLVGRNIELLDRILTNFGWATLGLLVVGIVAYVFWKRRRESTDD